jgi:hypothetical protein
MRLLLLATACCAALLGSAVAAAEVVQEGNLRLTFNGHFSPQRLPRDHAAPVSVRLGGSVATTTGGRPPALRRITLAVNRYGRLSTRGLPVCEAGQLESTSTSEARSRCREALIGHGRYLANVGLPNRPPFPVEGDVLAFNGRQGGRPTILLHIYGSEPVNVTVVLRFRISHPRRGDFGTVFSARIPAIASNLGYVTDISLLFERRYSYAGRRRSLFSARCAAPAGFGGALFTFARGRFDFANGQRLTTTLTRTCRVR